MKLETALIHQKWNQDFDDQIMSPPIVQSSTFASGGVLNNDGFIYGRAGNPGRNFLEEKIALLEGGSFCSCFSSGVAAIHAVFSLLKSGDEVLVSPKSYGGTVRILRSLESSYKVKVKWIDLGDLNAVEEAITSKTRLIWIETPTNPVLDVFDIIAIRNLANPAIWVAVDNTFATPIFQKPLLLGADMVVHSASKYLGGHSDALLGAVVTHNSELAKEIKFYQNSLGAIPAPFECFLVERGIKTLSLRMKKHQENAQALHRYLANHELIRNLNYPLLSEDATQIPGLLSGTGGVISFDLMDDRLETAIILVEGLKFFRIAESLGGVESLVTIPAAVSMKNVSKEVRYNNNVSDSLIRLSAGIEAEEDLVSDLHNALEHLAIHMSSSHVKV